MSTPSLPFDDIRPGLVRVGGARPATKKEQAVNRLLKKIEKLRDRFASEKRRCDAALVAFAAEVAPRLRRVSAVRADIARALAPLLDDRRLKKTERRELREIITVQIDEVFALDPSPPDDIRQLFTQLHGVEYERVRDEQFEEGRAEMEELLGALGMDVELPELRPDMTEEEVAAAVASMSESMQRHEEAEAARAASRPKTKRQLREEARAQRLEEARKVSLGSSYRRLAKALHPDLERDPEVRERKSAVMQEVTTAYARNDLHALLRLELEWLEGAGAASSQLADATLDAYIEFLKQQALELEEELMLLPLNPRYANLMSDSPVFGAPMLMDVELEARRLDVQLEGLLEIRKRLTSTEALFHAQELVRQRRGPRGRQRR